MTDVAKSYNDHASEWTKRLLEGGNPAHSLLEKPAMAAMVPDLAGKRILAIGCGSGEEVALLLAHGATPSNIVGIDVSDELIQTAQKTYPDAKFEVRAMENLDVFDDASFDFVYSSLTMHYALDWLPILSNVKRILSPGGRMLFSTHHPIKWGAEAKRGETIDCFRMGYDRPKAGMPTVYGDYLGSRQISDVWFGKMPVSYYHRPLGAIIKDILSSGLTIRDFVEPAPIPEARELNPGFHAMHSRIPMFMIFDLVK